jgi:acetyltransferase-like isoleucine patch superfamily enzyme
MSRSFYRWCTGLVAFLLPGLLGRVVLRALGHTVGRGVRIGLSLLLVDRLFLEEGARIGHFNAVFARRLLMRKGAYLGRLNVVHGPLSLALGPCAGIGNRNKLVRGPRGSVTYGPAMVRLGQLSKITADHYLDCTCSVLIGNFSILAGSASQLWTHGYVHDELSSGRYRIDGRIIVGNNVYLGSATIVTAGVRIADATVVGAGCTVAKSLSDPGLYVSASLRRLDRPIDPDDRTDLEKVPSAELCERVYRKRSTA